MDKLLTIDEVAEILAVKRVTVYGWVRKGELPGKKVGKKLWRISEQALDEFLHQQTKGAGR